MEQLLHYVWRHRMFPLHPLATTTGLEVEIINPGLANHDAGPDFFNAQIKIGGTMWAGNVELHIRASQWVQHGHHTDSAYNNTILHVVCEADAEAITADGKHIPTLVLPIPDSVRRNYNTLLHADDYPRCHGIVRDLSKLMVHSWMSALLVERIEQKAMLVLDRARLCNGDWERAFFITLARNFGFGKNGDAFELWARHLPLHSVAHHRDNMSQVEAFFLGFAGLLAPEALPKAHRDEGVADSYYACLQREYAYLSHKFQLPSPVDGSIWKFLRLRPQMFPHIKLIQLASLFHNNRASLSRILDIVSKGKAETVVKDLGNELRLPVPEYWQRHYLFGLESLHSMKRLSDSSIRLIIINTVVPTLWAYAMHTNKPELTQQAMELLEQLPPENNHVLHQWEACGLTAENAADSQALLHLKRTRCDTYDCLHCRFGYEFLKRTK